MRRLRNALVVTFVGVAVLGAATGPAGEDPWRGETFLKDYSVLKPAPSPSGNDYTYTAPGGYERFAVYGAVMVDQPEISIAEDSPYRCAKPDDLKAIAEFMRGTITARLELRGLQVVQQPGENVLYMRTALTHLQLKKKRRGVLSYTPIGAVVHEVKSAVQGVLDEVDILGMAGQSEIADSRTGEVLGAIVTRPNLALAGAKKERMTFDEFRAHVEEYSDRLACRIDNARHPAEERVDCADPAARSVPAAR